MPSKQYDYENTKLDIYKNKYLGWKPGRLFYEARIQPTSVHTLVIRVLYTDDVLNMAQFEEGFEYVKELQPIVEKIKI